MMPTLSRQVYEDVLRHLSIGLCAYLINHPTLGLGEPSEPSEYLRRYNLTMEEAVGREVLLSGGYKRFIFNQLTPIFRESIGYLILEPEWQAVGGAIGPFTHVCVAYNANTFNTSPANGNNRGDYQGSLILSYPCSSPSPNGLILSPPSIYKCRIPIKLIGREG